MAKGNKNLKYTLPGPMTIYDTVVNKYYNSELDCLLDIATLLNKEILELQKVGCQHIQLDEPVYARYPEKAIKYSKDLLEICFNGINVHKSLHMCCGYPDKLEQTDYLKADPNSYKMIAPILDNTVIDSISIEDAHRNNNLAILLPLFKNKIIIMGVVKISTVVLETEDQIVNRIKQALKYIDKERLWISPDCGLGMLPKNIAISKLKILAKAAKKMARKAKTTKKSAKRSRSRTTKRKKKRVSKIAKGRLAKAQVFKGRKIRTVGGLKKKDITRNKHGKYVSKKMSARGKKSKWMKAVMKARKSLKVKGF